MFLVNQEDSAIINKSAIERGMFITTSYRTIVDEEHRVGSTNYETFGLPPYHKRQRNVNYSLLDKNGIVRKYTDGHSTYVSKGDAVIGKFLTKSFKLANEEDIVDCSLVIKQGEEGYIDKIIDTVSNNGYRMIKIVLRNELIPEMGDKVACFSDVDVLTINGWKHISDISLDDKVAILEPKTDTLIYENPEILHKYDYNGYLYDLKSDEIELTTTPNHRMWVSQTNNDGFDFMQAYTCLNKNVSYKQTVSNYNSDIKHEKMKMPDFNNLQLPENYIELEKWAETFAILINYNIIDRIPNIIFNLSIEDSKIILKHIIKQDEFIHTNKQLLEDIGILSLHSGFVYTIHQHNNNEWKLNIHDRKQTKLNNKHEQLIRYNGYVYCLTVKTGIFLVRQNGKITWSGNSRCAQKSTLGMVMSAENMPFTIDGINPDIIINPHCIPSRMTINMLLEIILGKSCLIEGKRGDCTAFNSDTNLTEQLCEKLHQNGFERFGYQQMYSGLTGEPIQAKIFIGPCYYSRLKHIVQHKIHSRARGNVSILSRQPLSGRSRLGGLKLGQMESEALVSHGCSKFLRERLFDSSDKFYIDVCRNCGYLSTSSNFCKVCGSDVIDKTVMPYACKLLFQELMSMNIKMLFKVKD